MEETTAIEGSFTKRLRAAFGELPRVEHEWVTSLDPASYAEGDDTSTMMTNRNEKGGTTAGFDKIILTHVSRRYTTEYKIL